MRASWPTQELLRRGYIAQDHRASVSSAWRRFERGDAVSVCMRCGCETDVAAIAHSLECDEGRRISGRAGRRAAALGRD